MFNKFPISESGPTKQCLNLYYFRYELSVSPQLKYCYKFNLLLAKIGRKVS